jgi:hypothetical protein
VYPLRSGASIARTTIGYGYGTMEEASRLYTKEIRGGRGDRSDHVRDLF